MEIQGECGTQRLSTWARPLSDGELPTARRVEAPAVAGDRRAIFDALGVSSGVSFPINRYSKDMLFIYSFLSTNSPLYKFLREWRSLNGVFNKMLIFLNLENFRCAYNDYSEAEY